MRRKCALTALLVAGALQCAAQRPVTAPVFLRSRSISVTGGWGWPLSHDGLTKFWGPGPGASLEFLSSVTRTVAIGFDVDATAYWFRGPEFATAFPTIPFRNPPIAQILAGVVGRFTLAPGKRFSPYVGAMLGISHMTGAEYRQLTDSTNTTYFYMPFETRLAAGLIGGFEYRFSRALAFDVEGRALYVNNDPNVGVSALVRGGFRFIF